MIKNNIKVLLIYIIILLLTFALLSGINTLNNNSDLKFNNIIVKGFFILLYVVIFVLVGKLLGIKEKYAMDFFTFFLVFFIGLATYLIANLGGGISLVGEMNIASLPAYVFLSPFIFITTILGIKLSILNYTIISIFLSLIIGLSIRRNRVKRRRRKK